MGMFLKHSETLESLETRFLTDVKTPVLFPGTLQDSLQVVAGHLDCLSI